MKSEATVINMTDRAARIQYDTELLISEGGSRFETHWKNRKTRWSILLRRLSDSHKTHETHAEYMKMPKDRQDQIKDIGGFVGGHLQGGRRVNGSVAARQIITLDADFAPPDLAGEIRDSFSLECAWAIYSTHKHAPDKPRLRLIIPLDREVSADEYEAIARKVAEKVGIDWFDDSTYQPTRLMYWPSHSSDVSPFFDSNDAPILKADDVLAEYRDWTDVAEWPESSRMSGIRRRQADKQGDPVAKKGPVGLFCRTYTVPEAMEKFLPGVYVPTASPDRYTYAAGSTAAGVVIYEDGKFFYSNHATDPISGLLLNAFDLVRLYKFRELDEGSDKRGANAPSWKAMRDLIREDKDCIRQMYKEKDAEAKDDFAEPVTDGDWRLQLQMTAAMGIATTVANATLILENDEHLQDIRFNEMEGLIYAGDLPWGQLRGAWRDADDAQLLLYIAQTHGVEFPAVRLRTALVAVADRRKYHPVREYLESLPQWDGKERLDRLLTDYLGADDNIYTREVIRKSLTAAVARIYEPGIKFDYMTVLIGPQGAGKSTFFERLARRPEWFTDSLKMDMMNKIKDSGEQLQGAWIVEIGEMTGMKKADIEAVKSFVSRTSDDYRAAFGHYKEKRPRQCVVVGSTNAEEGFLRDVTGNRRFWPVHIRKGEHVKARDLTAATVDQIWAEAKITYELGEDLVLSEAAEALAVDAQREAMEQDDRQGLVEEYLERLLPEDWEKMDPDQRALFLDSDEIGVNRRTEVSNMEIWVEALHGSQSRLEAKDSYAIAKIMAKIQGWSKGGSRRLANYGKQRVYKRN